MLRWKRKMVSIFTSERFEGVLMDNWFMFIRSAVQLDSETQIL